MTREARKEEILAAALKVFAKGGYHGTHVDAIVKVLRQEPYDMELLISFGTSKGGSAGHLALALREAERSQHG